MSYTRKEIKFNYTTDVQTVTGLYAKFFPGEASEQVPDAKAKEKADDVSIGDSTMGPAPRPGFIGAIKTFFVGSRYKRSMYLPQDECVPRHFFESGTNLNYELLNTFKKQVNVYLNPHRKTDEAPTEIGHFKSYLAYWIFHKLIVIDQIKDFYERKKELRLWQKWVRDQLATDKVTDTWSDGTSRTSYSTLLKQAKIFYKKQNAVNKEIERIQNLALRLKDFKIETISAEYQDFMLNIMFPKAPVDLFEKFSEFHKKHIDTSVDFFKFKTIRSNFIGEFNDEYYKHIRTAEDFELLLMCISPLILKEEMTLFDMHFDKLSPEKRQARKKEIDEIMNRPCLKDVRDNYKLLDKLPKKMTLSEGYEEKFYSSIRNILVANNKLAYIEHYTKKARGIVDNVGNASKIFAREHLKGFAEIAKRYLTDIKKAHISFKTVFEELSGTPNFKTIANNFKQLVNYMEPTDFEDVEKQYVDILEKLDLVEKCYVDDSELDDMAELEKDKQAIRAGLYIAGVDIKSHERLRKPKLSSEMKDKEEEEDVDAHRKTDKQSAATLVINTKWRESRLQKSPLLASLFNKSPLSIKSDDEQIVVLTAMEKSLENLNNIVSLYKKYIKEWIIETGSHSRFFHGQTGIDRVNTLYLDKWKKTKKLLELKESLVLEFSELENPSQDSVQNAYKKFVDNSILKNIKKHIEAKYINSDKQNDTNKTARNWRLGNKRAYSFKTSQAAFYLHVKRHLTSENIKISTPEFLKDFKPAHLQTLRTNKAKRNQLFAAIENRTTEHTDEILTNKFNP